MIEAIIKDEVDLGAPIVDAGISSTGSESESVQIVENGKVNISEDVAASVCEDWESIPATYEDCDQFKRPKGVKRKDFDKQPLIDCKARNEPKE